MPSRNRSVSRCLALLFSMGLCPLTATPAWAAEATATFAGGCFWCMEQPFDILDGVKSTTSGYMGGTLRNPSYAQVSSGGTGHTEVVQVRYDADKISYSKLLDVFWRNIDPTVKNRQFCDTGSQYRTAIFFHDEAQRQAAEQSKAALAADPRFANGIATEINPAAEFWPAEDKHQDYYKRSPGHYKFYRFGCGRDQRLREIWGAAAAH